jgi:hypothetical protein
MKPLTIYTGLPVTPAASAKYAWLKPLARAYELVDNSIRADLSARVAGGKPQPVCGQGCGACCLAPVLNVTPIEMQGLSWYVSEVLAGPRRERVKSQLRKHRGSAACPFLVDGECAVYPARPLTCRHLYVLNKACTPSEHIEKSRPQDVLTVGHSGGHDAATVLLQAMTGKSEAECRNAMKRGAFAAASSLMHEMSLERLADVMDHFDR